MRRRITLAVAIVFGFCFSPGRARATDCAGPLSPCINADPFWPHAGPSQFEAVGGSATVAAGQLGFGLVADYASRPIVFKLPTASGGSQTNYAIDDQVNGTFLWSYGVTDRLELDFALPVTFGQSGLGLTPVAGGPGLHDTAMRDLRFGFAYAFLAPPRPAAPTVPTPQPHDFFGLAARFEVSAPSGDHDQFAGDRAGVFVPSLAADFRLGAVYGAAEIGARIRPTTQLLGARVGTQFVTAAGLGVDLAPHRLLSAAIEAWALETLVGQESALEQNGVVFTRPGAPALVPSEWQVSLRSAPLASGDFSIQVGGGGSIPWSSDGALTTPRFRFVLGVRWAPLATRPHGGSEPVSGAAPALAHPAVLP
jgi:hypothetical protein